MKKFIFIIFCILCFAAFSTYATNIKTSNDGSFKYISVPVSSSARKSLVDAVNGTADSVVPYQSMKIGEDGNIYSVLAKPNESANEVDVNLRVYNSQLIPIGVPIDLGELSVDSWESVTTLKFDLFVEDENHIYCLFACKPFYKIIEYQDGTTSYIDINVNNTTYDKYKDTISNFGGFYVYKNQFNFYYYVPAYAGIKRTYPAIIYTYMKGDSWFDGMLNGKKALIVDKTFSNYNYSFSADNNGFSNIIYPATKSKKVKTLLLSGTPAKEEDSGKLNSKGIDFYSNIGKVEGDTNAINAYLVSGKPVQVKNIPNNKIPSGYGKKSKYKNELIVGAIAKVSSDSNANNDVVAIYNSSTKTVNFIDNSKVFFSRKNVLNNNFSMKVFENMTGKAAISYFDSGSNNLMIGTITLP
ncbi:MAG: hypothetical protein GY756_07675 [bacterium]|nr:hypothetical protein [bacterium]